jgi:hypothetical protein
MQGALPTAIVRFASVCRRWFACRPLLVSLLGTCITAIGIGGIGVDLAHAAAPRVTVGLRTGSSASGRVALGHSLPIEVVATTTAEVDGARVTVFADPVFWRFDGSSRAPTFPLLSGAAELSDPGIIRLDVARAISPWPSGTVLLGTLRLIPITEGTTTISVVTDGPNRTRVAGNREELTLATANLTVVISNLAPSATPPVPPRVAPPAPIAWRPLAPAVAETGSGRPSAPAQAPLAAPTLSPLVDPPMSDPFSAGLSGVTAARNGAAPGAVPAGYEPGARPVALDFSGYYEQTVGMRLLGRPMGEAQTRGGFIVQWFEKGRLELHQDAPDGWKYQLGLLVDELARVFALVPLGGDTSTLTYADVARLSDASRRIAAPDGFVGGVAEMPDGSTFVPFDAALAPGPGHVVPNHFWRFLNDPAVFPGGWLHDAGLPITPLAEAVVTKAGVTRTILVQAFQRTILTFDPLNPADYVVECANVGNDFLRAIGPG